MTVEKKSQFIKQFVTNIFRYYHPQTDGKYKDDDSTEPCPRLPVSAGASQQKTEVVDKAHVGPCLKTSLRMRLEHVIGAWESV